MQDRNQDRIWLLLHTLVPSSVSKLERWYTETLRKRDNLQTGEGGVRAWGRSQIVRQPEKAWSSINISILNAERLQVQRSMAMSWSKAWSNRHYTCSIITESHWGPRGGPEGGGGGREEGEDTILMRVCFLISLSRCGQFFLAMGPGHTRRACAWTSWRYHGQKFICSC